MELSFNTLDFFNKMLTFCLNSFFKIGFFLILLFFPIFLAFLTLYFETTVYSIFNLILIFLFVIFSLLFIGIEYMAYTMLIVYVGAVAILFVFVVMLLGSNIDKTVYSHRKFILFEYTSYLLFVKYLVLSYFSLSNHLSFLSSQATNLAFFKTKIMYSNDIFAISDFLYGKYLFLFILISIVLLLAMLGALVLSLNYFILKKN